MNYHEEMEFLKKKTEAIKRFNEELKAELEEIEKEHRAKTLRTKPRWN